MFDFDATLPLMALQFVLLTFLLNAVFFKPISNTLDERDGYIRTNKSEAAEYLEAAEKLAYVPDRAAQRLRSIPRSESPRACASRDSRRG